MLELVFWARKECKQLIHLIIPLHRQVLAHVPAPSFLLKMLLLLLLVSDSFHY